MRRLSLGIIAVLAVVTPALVALPAHAGPAKPRAELVAKKTAAAVSTTRISVGTAVKNKGNKKAPKSHVTFFLSKDRTYGGDDKTVGTTTVGKIKPKRFKTTTGVFNLPAGLTTGSYYVVACADSGHAVKERKENNNCKGAEQPVQITGTAPPPSQRVTVTYSVAPVELTLVGKVTATATGGGTCTDDPITGGGSCVVTAGGTVTLLATPLVLPFKSWSGSCTGSNVAQLLTNLTANATCTATFGP